MGWLILLLLLALFAFVRLAPIDTARWHKPIADTSDQDRPNGAIRVRNAALGDFAKLDAAMTALARTKRIAGSVEEGRITYVTRSKAIGFPDFTTIEQDGNQLKLYARLRFGKSDLGVNRKRLEQVLAVLDEG